MSVADIDHLEMTAIEHAKNRLEEILKPFVQEQNQRQKKSDFLKKCIVCVEKNDFFQIDELLKSKQAADLLTDGSFNGCQEIFNELKAYADEQIERYRLQFKDDFIQIAADAGLPVKIDLPHFFFLKGIEGKIDFGSRTSIVNQTSLKSVDPRKIVSTALTIKRKLYDSAFEPQKFIDDLFECYKEILKKSGQAMGDAVAISQLYIDYVWSLQNKNFFQNMDKGKFKGYSIEQFTVDIWRYFESSVSSTQSGYCIRLNPGRIKSFWLIDQNGERRQITHASFVKN